MSGFDNPFNAKIKLNRGGCTCGQHANQAEHDQAEVLSGEEAHFERAVESAAVRALFPHDETRRAFICAVGAGTALFPFQFPAAGCDEGDGRRKRPSGKEKPENRFPADYLRDAHRRR